MRSRFDLFTLSFYNLFQDMRLPIRYWKFNHLIELLKVRIGPKYRFHLIDSYTSGYKRYMALESGFMIDLKQ